MKSLLNIRSSVLKYSYRQATNRHTGDSIKQVRGTVKGLMTMVMAVTAYSGVTRRPALSARLCCHNASHLLPPHTLDPFSPFHSPFTTLSLFLSFQDPLCHRSCCREPPTSNHSGLPGGLVLNRGRLYADRALTRTRPLQVILAVSFSRGARLSNHTVISAEQATTRAGEFVGFPHDHSLLIQA